MVKPAERETEGDVGVSTATCIYLYRTCITTKE